MKINELYFHRHREKSQYEFICIDTGIGIDKNLYLISSNLSRGLKIPGSANFQGTGLGMIITENIVRMMNGTIDIESTLGKGSKFARIDSFLVLYRR